MRTSIALALVSLLATGAAACGGGDSADGDSGTTLNTKAVQRALYKQLSNASDFIYLDVKCPEDVTVEAGGTFDCAVQGQRQVSGSVTVTQKDDQGKQIAFDGKIEGKGISATVQGTTSIG